LRRSQFDALWVHGYARAVNWLAIACAKLGGLKIFVRDDTNLVSSSRSRFRRSVKRRLFRLLANAVDGFLAIGRANRDYYLAQGIPPGQIFSMRYCVDNEFFAARAAEASKKRDRARADLGLEPGRPVILYASKFEARKRPQDLLRAYERVLERWGGKIRPYLIFAGDGELRPSVEEEAKAGGLSDVRFLGFRNQTELPALYDLCDVFVLPSLREPWGLVVNEVMAVGRAIIVSDEVGCAADLVADGVNGFVVPAGDVEALAQALTSVLSDRDRIRRMGEASRERIADWTFESNVESLRQILRTTLGPGDRAP